MAKIMDLTSGQASPERIAPLLQVLSFCTDPTPVLFILTYKIRIFMNVFSLPVRGLKDIRGIINKCNTAL